jgi:hypothetical protein
VEIVRLDDRSQRVFIEGRSDQIDTSAKARKILFAVQDSLRDCRPTWKDWSVSFFAERKFAGYKTEPELETSVQDGSWSRAYVGEYDRKKQRLVLNPSDPKKLKFLNITLP